jgi:hypothetical protein
MSLILFVAYSATVSDHKKSKEWIYLLSCGLLNKAVGTSDVQLSILRCLVNNEWESMQKEVALA